VSLKAVLLLSLLAGSMLAAAAAGARTDGPRQAYVKRHGIDPEYARAHNPLRPGGLNLEAGRKLYRKHCAACHGVSGLGSEAGLKLDPPATRLFGLSRRPVASDGFYDWTITEGGAPVGSAMPAYKGVLKQEEIWKIVLFLRTL